MTDPRHQWTDEHLDAVLASVGDHLDLENLADSAEPAPVLRAMARRTGAGWRGVAAIAAAVLVVALAVGVAVAPVRDAVADWLGIGSTRIEQVPDDEADPAGLPSLDEGLLPATPAEAEAALGRPLPDVDNSTLGTPNLVAVAPEGGVIHAWDQGETTLWVYALQDSPENRLHKLLSFDDDIELVDDLGEAALLLEGAHVLTTPDRRLASDSVVLWLRGGLEYRLESDLDVATMLDIARSMDGANR